MRTPNVLVLAGLAARGLKIPERSSVPGYLAFVTGVAALVALAML